MKQLALCFFSFLIAINSIGQKNIDGLVQVEKNFAAYSVANNTKEAFLKFLDSNGVVFDNGKPVNGIEFWNKREKRPGILNWYPTHAEIAASGDLGYTTGPWTFQAKTINDSVLARGQYTTVWHINKNGEWKFLVDLGTGNNPAPEENSLHKIEIKKHGRATGDEGSLLFAENGFINELNRSKQEAYKKYQSTYFSLLKRHNIQPAWLKKDLTAVIDSTPGLITYTILSSGIASSGDLGYVYGSTVMNGKTENYLRIWRKEKKGWKIAVEVLRY
ncbi:MAG: nuclear transport factor 2 family protein [Bacteroidota bacterium]